MSTIRRTLTRRGVGAGVVVLLLAAGPATGLEVPGAAGEPRRYLVQFEAGADPGAMAQSLRDAGLGVGQRFRHAIRGAVVTAGPHQAAALARRPGVAAVARDTPVLLAGPWGLDRVDQRALPLSGTFTPPGDGAGAVVYVVDTGVRSDHEDLGGRVAPGYSAVDGSSSTEDCFGHGTHVAGTVAGATYGVARATTVVPVRVMGCDGKGTTADVLQGLDWMVGNHTTAPAVANLSLTTPANVVLDAAVQGVVDDGIVVTAAAGNANTDACGSSPGRVPAALTVGATDDTDAEAPFGNDGPCLDLFAPGVAVVSAWHTSTTAESTQSGTSMASPHVAGAAAVALGAYPALSPAEVAAGLIAASTRGVVTGEAAGTPDRLLYIGALPPLPVAQALPPTRPRDVRARAGVRSAVVRWTRGAPRGTPVTRQAIRVYWKGIHVRTVRVAATAARHRVLGMKPGRRVVFRVVALSAVGPSLPSARSNRVTIRR